MGGFCGSLFRPALTHEQETERDGNADGGGWRRGVKRVGCMVSENNYIQDVFFIINQRIRADICCHTGCVRKIKQLRNARCNNVYYISADNGEYVIKIATGGVRKQELKNEADIMVSIKDKVNVPNIFMLKEKGNISFVLMEYINGDTLQKLLSNSTKNKHDLIHGMGQTLSLIHKINPQQVCDYENSLTLLLQKATENMENNFLDEDEFIIDNEYVEPEKLLNSLTSRYPKMAAVCLLHGDYRPKNIIYNNRNIVIDWGLSIIGDPYYDLAIILDCYYLNKQEQTIFLDGYGIKDIDAERLAYFRNLSKFINV
jgi:aminoglycoside phosphotransferase